MVKLSIKKSRAFNPEQGDVLRASGVAESVWVGRGKMVRLATANMVKAVNLPKLQEARPRPVITEEDRIHAEIAADRAKISNNLDTIGHQRAQRDLAEQARLAAHQAHEVQAVTETEQSSSDRVDELQRLRDLRQQRPLEGERAA